MKILVTGGTGYIGENFVPRLIDGGYSVRLLVRNADKAKMLFDNKCEYWVGDISEPISLKGCCKDIDIVYHMAAISGNQLPSKQAFQLYRKTNVEGTCNILEEAKKSQVSRFIYLSSTAAMGIVKKLPINEESYCTPILPYQVSKLEAEQKVNEYINDGFPAIIIRPTKIYGVGEHEYSYLSLARMCKKGFILKIGRGRNLASYLYITDFISALICLIDRGIIGQTYILSSDESIGFLESQRSIARVLDKKVRTIYIPTVIMRFFAYIIETFCGLIEKKPIFTSSNIEAISSSRIYDISKAKEEMSFCPMVSMKKGIELVVRWYMDEKII